MMAELEKDRRFLPSEFWRDINAKNLDMIASDGLLNFKRTVSQNYYNWLITRIRDPQFRKALAFWLLHPSLKPLETKIEKEICLRFTNRSGVVTLTPLQRLKYKIFATLVWEQMLKHDKHGFSKILSEPELGNPIKIWQGQKIITQDLANSIVECNVIADTLSGISNPKIAEIGAGSGRLAHVYSSTQPGSYMIFDIPPALMVSQWYLSKIFPNKKIFLFRSFDHFEDIRQELESCDIAFFTANQMALFPKKYFNLILSISTLPEMRPDQVSMYLDLFSQLSSGYIYLKQWISWKNPLDGTDIKIEDYLVGDSWSLVLDRIDPINPRFFNRVWQKIE
ncbi:MAG: putative sugar O-methyltransferase [Betaproteobacteria bacterium]|nr:putative sugar O-methyltransferase [Betaproteobacteria bacterium]